MQGGGQRGREGGGCQVPPKPLARQKEQKLREGRGSWFSQERWGVRELEKFGRVGPRGLGDSAPQTVTWGTWGLGTVHPNLGPAGWGACQSVTWGGGWSGGMMTPPNPLPAGTRGSGSVHPSLGPVGTNSPQSGVVGMVHPNAWQEGAGDGHPDPGLCVPSRGWVWVWGCVCVCVCPPPRW